VGISAQQLLKPALAAKGKRLKKSYQMNVVENLLKECNGFKVKSAFQKKNRMGEFLREPGLYTA